MNQYLIAFSYLFTSVTLGLHREQFVACTRSVARGHIGRGKDKAEVVDDNKAFWVSDGSILTSLAELKALSRLNCVELAKVQRRNGPTIYTGKRVHGPRSGKERNIEEGERRSCAQTLYCAATRHQG
jgi:hypothetical protein